MENMLRITNDRGRNFNVRIVREGDRYGRDDCLVYDPSDREFNKDDVLVEFYDATYTAKFGERGQFVSRYYATTLLGTDEFGDGMEEEMGVGLDLMGYEPAWKIDADAMDIVRLWVHNQTEGEL